MDEGIDKKLIGTIFGDNIENINNNGCDASFEDCGYRCRDYFRVSSNTWNQLREIIKEKNIDPHKFGKVADKLF